MAKETKYSIRNLKRDFPDDSACTEFIFDALHNRVCSCGGKYKLIKGRRQLQCGKCRFQIAPTSGTIFHKSPTELNLWFHAIFVFSNAKSGVSAKQLERELGVTYKCAWRMLNLIRKALKQDGDKLLGAVEVDSTSLGGRQYTGKYGENASEARKRRPILLAAVARNGMMRAKIVPDNTRGTVLEFVRNNVDSKSLLITDSYTVFDNMGEYAITRVNHKNKEYARNGVHVNSLETWFAHVKRSMAGTYKSLSKKHLQAYVDSFVWHYNNRHNDKVRFSSLLGALLQSSR